MALASRGIPSHHPLPPSSFKLYVLQMFSPDCVVKIRKQPFRGLTQRETEEGGRGGSEFGCVCVIVGEENRVGFAFPPDPLNPGIPCSAPNEPASSPAGGLVPVPPGWRPFAWFWKGPQYRPGLSLSLRSLRSDPFLFP